MKISYNWLKELLPTLELSPEEVAEALTMHAFETEVTGKMKIADGVIVAKIISLAKHPDADRLRLATIDTGTEEVTVVCGAPNIFEGALVPYSAPGCVLQDEDGNNFKLKVAKIRGVESPGMLNSPRELGLGDTHDGIYLLPDDTVLGTKLVDHLPEDIILDADITPNRAHDCMSHFGVASELAALLNREVVAPEEYDLAAAPGLEEWEINIENPNDALRYLGVLLDGVEIKPSSFDVQAKLWAAGGKPINNVVDVTNLVLFELGQPTHAFDTSCLDSKKIGIRRANSGESVEALDEVKYELDNEDIVITDNDKPTAIAGVMGGLDSGIKENTEHVFLEAANFRSFAIQETSRKLKLISESSKRFSKGLTPEYAGRAASRAIALLVKHAGANVVGVNDNYPTKATAWEITFNPKRVNVLSGSSITEDDAKNILERLGCLVDSGSDSWRVTPPVERLDLQGEHDLVEEVVRVYGLSAIEPIEPEVGASGIIDAYVQQREVIRDLLVEQGFSETMSYSFTEEGELELVNPVSPEQAMLRTKILPQVLRQVLNNRSELSAPSNKERGLFEIGVVFSEGSTGRVPGVEESDHLALVAVGSDAEARIPGVKAKLTSLLGVGDDLFTADNDLANKVSSKLGMPVAGFETNLSKLIAAAERENSWQASLQDSNNATQFQALPKYPAVYRDIAVLVAPNVSVEDVQEIVERAGGNLLVDVDLFDEYEPKGEDEKSLAFHLTYQSSEKTLSDQDVAELHNKIVATLYEEINAKLRE